MRRSMVSLFLLICVVFAGLAFYIYLSVSVDAREASNSTAAADPMPIAMTRTITAGVILTGEASDFGWGDLAFVGDYADLTIAGQRVIVYENFNPTDRPGTTLEQVVNSMAEYARPEVYFFSVGRLTPDEIKIDERYANTVFIMNLATRVDVETLLTVLPATDADINRAMLSDPIAAAPPLAAAESEAAEDTQLDPSAVALPAALVTLVMFVLVGGLFGRRRQRPAKKKAKRQPGTGFHAKSLAIQDAVYPTDFAALGEALPVIHKLSTFVSGDRYYDESFPIELPDKTFLGECGIGITAPIKPYDKDKVFAFEAWLFDKHDIRTRTAVLCSEYAANDDLLCRKLRARGSLIEAKPGTAAELETETLRLQVCVLDTQYGFSDTLPPRSFFDHLVVELAVWQK